jgi:hypothetical protein
MKKATTNYDIKFNIGDKVKIACLDVKGKITGIFIGAQRTTYQVRYFSNMEPKEVYFYADDLELLDDSININYFNPSTK